MIEIRVIAPQEWQSLRAIRLEALETAPEAFCTRYEDAVCRDENSWRERLINNGEDGVLTVLAFDETRPVGMSVGVLHAEGGEPFVEVLSVFVSSDVRGQGLADRILHSIEEWGRARGAAALSLLVEEKNPRARRFYERQGWEHVNEWVSSPSSDDRWQTRYRKKMSPL